MPAAAAVARLRELAERGKALGAKGTISDEDWDLWVAAIEDDGAAAFGRYHPHIDQIRSAGPSTFVLDNSHEYYRRLAQKAAVQSKMIAEYADRLERTIKEQPPAAPTAHAPVCVLSAIFARFHRVARQLRHRHGDRPTLDVKDEYDVQDLLHALLLVEFDDVRPEEYAPSYEGASPRMDFLLKQHGIVIETKMTRPTLGAKQLGDELLADIGRYASHPDCRHLVCFVYDPTGIIGNPKGLAHDLTGRSTDRLRVSVFIEPN